jgi:uncharacterized membrane protein
MVGPRVLADSPGCKAVSPECGEKESSTMRTPRQRRDENGQAFVLSILFLAALLAISAAVLDVGAWYRAHRHLQASVDAAALAGAQALPDDPSAAAALANEYLDKNGGATTRSITIKSRSGPATASR